MKGKRFAVFGKVRDFYVGTIYMIEEETTVVNYIKNLFEVMPRIGWEKFELKSFDPELYKFFLFYEGFRIPFRWISFPEGYIPPETIKKALLNSLDFFIRAEPIVKPSIKTVCFEIIIGLKPVDTRSARLVVVFCPCSPVPHRLSYEEMRKIFSKVLEMYGGRFVKTTIHKEPYRFKEEKYIPKDFHTLLLLLISANICELCCVLSSLGLRKDLSVNFFLSLIDDKRFITDFDFIFKVLIDIKEKDPKIIAELAEIIETVPPEKRTKFVLSMYAVM